MRKKRKQISQLYYAINDYLLIALGLVLYAFGWTAFILSNEIVTGGDGAGRCSVRHGHLYQPKPWNPRWKYNHAPVHQNDQLFKRTIAVKSFSFFILILSLISKQKVSNEKEWKLFSSRHFAGCSGCYNNMCRFNCFKTLVILFDLDL